MSGRNYFVDHPLSDSSRIWRDETDTSCPGYLERGEDSGEWVRDSGARMNFANSPFNFHRPDDHGRRSATQGNDVGRAHCIDIAYRHIKLICLLSETFNRRWLIALPRCRKAALVKRLPGYRKHRTRFGRQCPIIGYHHHPDIGSPSDPVVFVIVHARPHARRRLSRSLHLNLPTTFDKLAQAAASLAWQAVVPRLASKYVDHLLWYT
ncbi:hypothetical protein C7450_10686 [Chelatococcus asaccharovorans]|uniref:Uncharacterized protein n=1 Tax=Chelatococcus asaccharovorans TaxID=28210 RepID=A0A2V3U5Z9_9HYPH|nr:hypothetical protein C7450_10686 [Chelatococcus asaccharovorans]